MKHTPGPWAYFENHPIGYSIFQANVEDDGYEATVLATVEDEDDANIIAAAPDMLKLLKGTLRYLMASGNRAQGLQRDISALLEKIGEGDLNEP